jgi:hypothetical protein
VNEIYSPAVARISDRYAKVAIVVGPILPPSDTMESDGAADEAVLKQGMVQPFKLFS